MEYTKRLAKLACGIEYEKLPPEVIKLAKDAILDTIGVTLAGSIDESARIITEYVEEIGGRPEATIINKKIKSSVINATLANGAMGHILDYDDVSFTIIGHPAVVTLPAGLAIAERDRLSGKQLIAAFVTGYEVTAALGRAMCPTFCSQGWHSTSTLGTFGATATAGKLLGLAVDQMVTALGIAGSEAAGVKGNMGTMTKHFHAGRTASDGVRAALLSKKGYTATPEIFEGKDSFCRVFSKEYDLDKMIANFGNPYDLVHHGCLFKKWPSVYATHPIIEASLYLAETYNIKPDQVKIVTVSTPPLSRDVLFYKDPKNGVQGKFSAAFVVASSIVKRQVNLTEFTDEVVQLPEIQRLIKKVDHIVDPEYKDGTYAPATEDGPTRAKVLVELYNGRTLEKEIQFAKGSPQRRLTEAELVEKYESCAGLVISKEKVDQTIDILLNLEKQATLQNLVSLIS